MPEDRLFHSCLGHSNKVNSLTDFEEIVWRNYINSADDFGVMRFNPVMLQAKFDRLARKPARTVQKALDRIFNVHLVFLFLHQGVTFCYQRDWQEWQHVRYPRETKQPSPPPDELRLCDRHTQWLFSHHPKGGKLDSWRAPKAWNPSVKSWGDIAKKTREAVKEPFRENGPEKHTRTDLTVDLSHEPLAVCEEIPGRSLDVLLDLFLREVYPRQGYQQGWEVEQSWIAAFEGQPDVEAHYALMCAAVAQHTRSIQWQEGKIPLAGKWLKEHRWNAVLREPKDASRQSDRTQRIATATEEFLNEPRG